MIVDVVGNGPSCYDFKPEGNITVGCNVGEFNSTNECYTEAWLRATNNGEPTGAISHFGSTISQSWEPPMHGQYAMNLILTESYENKEQV